MKLFARVMVLAVFFFCTVIASGWCAKPPAKKVHKKKPVKVASPAAAPVHHAAFPDPETETLAPLIPSVAQLSKKKPQTTIKVAREKPDTDKDATLDDAVLEDPENSVTWRYLEKR